MEREIGRVAGRRAGPTLVAMAGVHGNEPAGVPASERVLARLGGEPGAVRGELVALAGNLGALRAKERLLAEDLNRLWTDERVEALRGGRALPQTPESHEQVALLDALDAVTARSRGSLHLVDLHTTSAHGTPFTIATDAGRQRSFALAVPLPAILGLERFLAGVLAEYLARHGWTTLSVEGGQHDDPASVDHLEAALWVTLGAAGILEAGAFPEVDRSRALLDARRGALPRAMEVLSRHAVAPGDGFAMEPGFRNLDFARAGQLLARDRAGEIRAPSDGMVILPRYQREGADGFFWGRAIPG